MLLEFAELFPRQGKAMYCDLYEQMKAAAETGAIKKGEKLPSIREAAALLGVSRTTVENAYQKLCMEGIAESVPHRGYYLAEPRRQAAPERRKSAAVPEPVYDFSTRRIDLASADTEHWRKTVRLILRDSEELISYGDTQGEAGLRRALADYAYQARGVRCRADNIVIGAGVGPLLHILCGLLGKNRSVGIENGGFPQADRIFKDYGIDSRVLPSDASGALPEALPSGDCDLLLLMPSLLSKIRVTALIKRRGELIRWAAERDGRLILEDDYNGELRYTARSVSAFQGKLPEKTVYLGSFSKLLLPSVRIAYMVLPDALTEQFQEKKAYYNQTCGKMEQLALQHYIETGALEKHLRRLRKLYYRKSRILCDALSQEPLIRALTLYESSLTVKVETALPLAGQTLFRRLLDAGVQTVPFDGLGETGLCFAGIGEPELPRAADFFCKALSASAIRDGE